MVIDASAIISVVTNEPDKSRLISTTTNVDLIAPASIHFEIGNAFSAMLKRNRITIQQALIAIEQYQSIPIRFVDVELEGVIQIADQMNIYAYDAYLIRCAEKYRMPLLTLDRALRVHASAYGIQIVEVLL